jgi:hypothetical protein
VHVPVPVPAPIPVPVVPTGSIGYGGDCTLHRHQVKFIPALSYASYVLYPNDSLFCCKTQCLSGLACVPSPLPGSDRWVCQ